MKCQKTVLVKNNPISRPTEISQRNNFMSDGYGQKYSFYVTLPKCCGKWMILMDWRNQTKRWCKNCSRSDTLRKDLKWQTETIGEDGQGLKGLVDEKIRLWY